MSNPSSLPTFSDYIVFVDESGDHGLVSIDEQYPVFALVFVVIRKEDYINQVVPAFQQLKMKYWGHDQIILHEHDIRKEKGAFALLRTDPALRERFYQDVTALIKESPFRYIASTINKIELKKRYANPYNPYEICMLFCMESLANILRNHRQRHQQTCLVIEGRGKEENKELELEFRRICDNQRWWGYRRMKFDSTPMNLVFASKHSNSSGLQLADLIARPIALSQLRPSQKNRAFDAIQSKRVRVKWFP